MTVESKGLWIGLVGIIIFSMTLPLTRIGLRELDPLFLSVGRTVLAAAIAAPLLLLTNQPWPTVKDLRLLVFVVAGVILGFPVFSALAMRNAPAAHGGVVLGALPLATALMSTIFAGERPSITFWAWSLAGSAVVVAFALRNGGTDLAGADLLLLLAVIAASMGYAAGGQLSKTLGGWQVICWALVLALPITLPITAWLFTQIHWPISGAAWGAFLYLSVMSQLVGFFFWNQGLATGGIARVGQVQLLQSFFTLGEAALILGEKVTLEDAAFALAVVACVWMGRKAAMLRSA